MAADEEEEEEDVFIGDLGGIVPARILEQTAISPRRSSLSTALPRWSRVDGDLVSVR